MRDISPKFFHLVIVAEAIPDEQARVFLRASSAEDSARIMGREMKRADQRGWAWRRSLLAAVFSGRLT